MPGVPADPGPATAGDGVSIDPPVGQGEPAISAFEFVRSAHDPVGAGGVRAAINSDKSEFPSDIGCTCRLRRAFSASIIWGVIGEVLLRIEHCFETYTPVSLFLEPKM